MRPVKVLRVNPQNFQWSEFGPHKIKRFLADIIKSHALGVIQTPHSTFLLAEDSSGPREHPATPPTPEKPNTEHSSPSEAKHSSEFVTQHKQSANAKGKQTSDMPKVESRSFGIENELTTLIDQSSASDPLANFQWVHFVDSGGQPQFHEVLPAFLRGTSVCLFTFKLCEELQQHPLVEYYDENGELVGEPYQADHSNEEILKHCITTIQSHKSRAGKGKAPRVVILGTHRDREGECKAETRQMKNEKLRSMLLPSLQDEVVYNGQGMRDLIFPLNARAPGPEDKRVGEQIRNVIMESLPEPEQIPTRWYILEQLLKEVAQSRGVAVLSKDECFAAAQSLYFDRRSHEAALKRLDQLQLICYYDTVLPDIVFTDSQVLLDKVSEPVQYSFQLQKAPLEGVATGGELQKFRDYGVVTQEFFDRFPKHYVPGVFTSKELIKLFRALLLLADLDSSTYFMPSILLPLSSRGINSHRVDPNAAPAAPLILCFKHGPGSGIFCSLIAFLLSPENPCPAPWQLVLDSCSPACLYRNCVEFSIPGYPGSITLIDSFHFFEVHINMPLRMGRRKCPQLCPIVSDAVLLGLREAATTLGYSNCKPQRAFICPCGKGSSHSATIGDDQTYWVCSQDPRMCDDLEDNQTVWLCSTTQHKGNLATAFSFEYY